MFIDRSTPKRPPRSRGAKDQSEFGSVGTIALLWSASYRVQSILYKHLAPLERKANSLLRFPLEFTDDK